MDQSQSLFSKARAGSFAASARRRRHTQSGQAVLFVTLSLSAILGAIGLAVDFGWAYWRKEACATAASSVASAAIAAANSAANQSCGTGTGSWNCGGTYQCPPNPALPAASNLDNGCLYAKQNGFLNTGNQTVTMQAGTGAPPTAPGTSASYYVTATVSEQIPTLFSAAIGQRWMRVSAQSTAAIMVGTAGGCIFILDPGAVGALSMNGTTALADHCGIYVNSGATGAITMVGTSSITTTGGAKTYVAGSVAATSNTDITPSAVTGVNATPDPFAAYLPAVPATSACQPTAQFTGSGNHAIPAGTYCDQVSQGGSGTLTLTSGTYVLQAGISVGSSAALTATGPVTLYISGGGVSLSGGGGVTLSAPTSGPYQGMTIWQPSSNSSAATLVGGSGAGIAGLIYMPAAALTFTGNSKATTTTLVVDTLTMKGTSLISNGTSVPWAGLSPNGTFLVQ